MDPITNKIWNLGTKENQLEVLQMIRRDKPQLLIACPPCTLFSNLQFIEGDPEIRRPEEWAEAVKLVEFAVKVCELQRELGGGFVFEHPQSASSWRKIPALRRLWGADGVEEAVGHMCAFGMTAIDVEGEGPVLKPTRPTNLAIGDIKD